MNDQIVWKEVDREKCKDSIDIGFKLAYFS